jgi:uncharacterized coiled-coil protein SlyX
MTDVVKDHPNMVNSNDASEETKTDDSTESDKKNSENQESLINACDSTLQEKQNEIKKLKEQLKTFVEKLNSNIASDKKIKDMTSNYASLNSKYKKEQEAHSKTRSEHILKNTIIICLALLCVVLFSILCIVDRNVVKAKKKMQELRLKHKSLVDLEDLNFSTGMI